MKYVKGCAFVIVAVLIITIVVGTQTDVAPPSTADTPQAPSQPSEPASPYISAGGNLWTGVKLYYGPQYMLVGEVLGGNDKYVSPVTGEQFRGLKIRYPDGKEEWKDRSAVVNGPWYVRRDDPALTRAQWRTYQF